MSEWSGMETLNYVTCYMLCGCLSFTAGSAVMDMQVYVGIFIDVRLWFLCSKLPLENIFFLTFVCIDLTN